MRCVCLADCCYILCFFCDCDVYLLWLNRIHYYINIFSKSHPYEGSVNSLDEQERFVTSLGPTHKVLMLENHGPVVLGARLEEAFSTMWFLTRACQYQQRALSSVGGDLSRINLPCDQIRQEMDRRAAKFDEAPQEKEKETVEKHDTEALMFECARRAAERHFGAENIYV